MATTAQAGYALEVLSEIGEDLAATAYLRLKLEGLTDYVFYQGGMSLGGFLEWYRNPGSKFMGCFLRPDLDKSSPEFCGLGWIHNINRAGGVKRGETGMAFFRDYQRHGWPKEWTGKLLDFSFFDAKFDVLYGTTPEKNLAAVHFSRQMGFKQFGPLPLYCNWRGRPCGAIISAMTRDEWKEIRNGRL